jgi:hypothetical protein
MDYNKSMNAENDRQNDNPNRGMRKVRIALPEDAWHKVEAEWLWAEKINDNIYALRNTPFYALGLSYGDRVRVNDADENPTMLGVVSRGGHSTYRIFAKKGQENPRVRVLLKKLNELHCGIEGATQNLIAVDVLPEADISKVYRALEDAEQAGIIDFEEGHCGHPLTSKPN